jgi:hypothetical protein
MTTPQLPWTRTPTFAHVEVGKVLVHLDYLHPTVVITGSLPWPEKVPCSDPVFEGLGCHQETMRLVLPWPKGIQAFDKEAATGDSDATLVAIEGLLHKIFTWQETSGREGIAALGKD